MVDLQSFNVIQKSQKRNKVFDLNPLMPTVKMKELHENVVPFSF